MTVTTHQVSDTTRTRLVRGADGGQLVLREERRTLAGGKAWCIVSAELVDARRSSGAWPT